MKRIITLSFLIILLSAFTVNAMGMKSKHPHQRHRNHQHNYNSGGAVGAPLDGGLLAVLGVAGVAYITARKRKKKDIGA